MKNDKELELIYENNYTSGINKINSDGISGNPPENVSYTTDKNVGLGNWYKTNIKCLKCEQDNLWRFEMSKYLICLNCSTLYDASGTSYHTPKISNINEYRNYIKKIVKEIKSHIGYFYKR